MTMKKHLTGGTTSSYSHHMSHPVITAERMLFEIEILKHRLDELTKRVTPLLHASEEMTNKQILINKATKTVN